jgi:hypothetical protein
MRGQAMGQLDSRTCTAPPVRLNSARCVGNARRRLSNASIFSDTVTTSEVYRYKLTHLKAKFGNQDITL